MIGPVLKYPGSKWRMADWIVENMPKHGTYLEPFFGSGAAFFTKKPSHIETINDLDQNIIKFFRILREQPEELARLIEFTPWSRVEYEDLLTSAASENYFKTTDSELENARRLMVRLSMGFGSKTSDRTGWRSNIQSKVGGSASTIWKSMPARIRSAAERLKDAQIECRPAMDLIKRYNYPEVLIYADPPYMFGTRFEKRQYKHEMSDVNHAELIEALNNHSGTVLLSGYACDFYDDKLKHWTRKTTKSWAEGGRQREEVLWINPAAARGLSSLF